MNHPIYGEVELKVPITKEDNCQHCLHDEVCRKSKEAFCRNYTFGTTQFEGCHSCTKKYTRFCSVDPVPCFKCKHFEPNEQ